MSYKYFNLGSFDQGENTDIAVALASIFNDAQEFLA